VKEATLEPWLLGTNLVGEAKPELPEALNKVVLIVKPFPEAAEVEMLLTEVWP
jgi:hypothetical protein